MARASMAMMNVKELEKKLRAEGFARFFTWQDGPNASYPENPPRPNCPRDSRRANDPDVGGADADGESGRAIGCPCEHGPFGADGSRGVPLPGRRRRKLRPLSGARDLGSPGKPN